MQTSIDQPILHCPHCLDEVHRLSHFCVTCGMPITPHATIGPLEHVWAFGWLINRLLGRRPTAMTVLGTWLISLPVLIPAVPTLLLLPFVTPAEDLPHALIGVVPTGLFAACYAILVGRVTLAYGRRSTKPPRAGECRRGNADGS